MSDHEDDVEDGQSVPDTPRRDRAYAPETMAESTGARCPPEAGSVASASVRDDQRSAGATNPTIIQCIIIIQT